jgi:hypothetical protein
MYLDEAIGNVVMILLALLPLAVVVLAAVVALWRRK